MEKEDMKEKKLSKNHADGGGTCIAVIAFVKWN